jgi:hypothetical protein
MRGHLLDLHAALAAGQQRHALSTAINHHTDIEFLADLRAFLDQQAPHHLAVRAGLVRDQMHAQYLLRCAAHLFLRARHLYTSTLATSAGMDLRLHHPHRTAQLLSSSQRLINTETRHPTRSRDAELAQNFLALVFVNLHIVLINNDSSNRILVVTEAEDAILPNYQGLSGKLYGLSAAAHGKKIQQSKSNIFIHADDAYSSNSLHLQPTTPPYLTAKAR